MKIFKFILTVCAAAVVLVWLGSCSRSFVVRVNGRLGATITFQFYDERGRATDATIRRFAVEEQTSTGSWVWVWALTGARRLHELTYGAKYEGLQQLRSPRKLVPGVKYRVFAEDASGDETG